MGQALAGPHEQATREAVELEDGGDDDCEGCVAEELLERSGVALEVILASDWGYRHEQLAPEPHEALLAMLGEPVDMRPAWEDLGRDLRLVMLMMQGSHTEH